ncbi:MAG: EAL domain-containing response regulator [Rhodobiaceae bacterium]|nr:EAL domain-containing response regulator [Rhodobiaceae bacterium]
MLNPKVVLTVDDDPLVHLMVEAFFRNNGAQEIITASDGADGLRKLDGREADIDLIVVDLNMPDIDGLQFLRHLMERRFRKPVIIASGENSDIVRAAYNLAESHNLNIAGRINKPIRADVLAEILANPKKVTAKARVEKKLDVGEWELRAALRLGEIVPFFQPKIDIASGRAVGAEALARWFHPEYGMIPPDVFVPIAEKAELVRQLTTCMLRQVLGELDRWNKAGLSINVAINTDAHTVNQLGFPDEVLRHVRDAGLSASQLTFEVTERSMITDGAASIEVITRLRMMEFGISIDDFGTGNSNIKQLCTYPFTELKIDKSFLQDVDSDRTRAICLNAIVKLAKALNLHTVAEGIETEHDLELVRAAGIAEAQGYFFAKPMSADDFFAWANDRVIRKAS